MAAANVELVYLAWYCPKQSGNEWLWRIVRRAVTHNHHCEEFAVLLDDLGHEFATLTQNSAAVLAHIGSPFALDDEPTQPLAYAA